MRQRRKVTIVVALVLIDAVLLFFLSQKVNDSKVATDRDTKPVRTTPSPASTPETVPPGGPQGIAIADDGSIFRFYSGSCDGDTGPGVTVSTDEGATFDEVSLPDAVRSIFTLTAKTADDVELVAAGKDCKPQRRVTADAGAGWRTVQGVDAWYLQPGTDDVYSPLGAVDPGCIKTVAVAPVGRARSRAFCATGVVVGSADTGRTWQRLGALERAKAGTFLTADLGYALAPDGTCRTRVFSSQNRGATWAPAGCLDAAPGQAIAAHRDLVAAIAGDDVWVSKDGGRTWAKV